MHRPALVGDGAVGEHLEHVSARERVRVVGLLVEVGALDGEPGPRVPVGRQPTAAAHVADLRSHRSKPTVAGSSSTARARACNCASSWSANRYASA